MTPRRKRLIVIAGVIGAVGVATALVLNAFQSNLVFFYSPSQVAAHEAPAGRTFRLGGLVERGSLERRGLDARFVVTDTAQTIAVRYEGILPDLFKEGKGVVAQGRLGSDGVFVAREVLAKHDENYMPPEAAAAIERARAKALPVDMPPVDATHIDGTRVDAMRLDAVRVDPTRVDPTRVDATRVDATRVDATRVDATRVDATDIHAAHIDATRVDATRIDATGVDTTRREARAGAVPQ